MAFTLRRSSTKTPSLGLPLQLFSGSAIPFSLVGILPAHGALGAFFTATSMIGFMVVVGAAVILFDPIFQELATSLMAGEIASLFISRMAVPVLYYMAYARPGARDEGHTRNTHSAG